MAATPATASAATPAGSRPRLWRNIGIGVATFVALLVVLVLFFPWDLLRGPINRYVSEKTGRTFEITERLEVHPGRTTGIILHGVRFANPDWARDPQLIEADRIELDVSFMPLLRGKLVLPRLHLFNPRVAMQLEPDGRRSWAFGKDTGDKSTVPDIGVIRVDAGELKYLASEQGADIKLNFDYDQSATGNMPLKYAATGTWKKQAFKADGRAGDVMQLNEAGAPPFPVIVNAQAGKTSLKADGTVARIADFDGVDATVEMRGASLGDLYGLIGVALPQTSPYALKGRLQKQADLWAVNGMQGKLGSSDLSGDLSFDSGPDVPVMKGKLQSKILDMDDLGPLIGLAPRTTKIPESADAPVVASAAKPEVKQQPVKQTAAVTAGGAPRKVLPTAPLDAQRLRAMNADISYSAATIRHLQEVPLEKGTVRVLLQDSVLNLDPLDLTVAGGTVKGKIRIDGKAMPADVHAALDVRSMRLNKLFPTVEKMDSSLGAVSGGIDLRGRGNSVAQWLGSSSGNIQAVTGRGQLSNLLLEILGLDGGEIIKFFVEGDRNVRLRCAVADFDVKQGQAGVRTFVVDTTDTVVNGEGSINLTDETLALVLRPKPKDASILSLRSPLKISGSFSTPSAFPDKAALAGRAGLAIALGVINPLLALAATIETGPGEDTDCAGLLTQTATGGGTGAAAASKAATAEKAAQKSAAPAVRAPAR